MLVNNIHWEGTNLALISGKFAGETAIKAIKQNDFSKKVLVEYEKKLKKSFIFKDMKSYKNLMPAIHSRSKSFLGFYPKKINEFFSVFTSVNSIPKKTSFRKYILSFFKERSLLEPIKDGFTILKLIFEVLK